MDEETVTENLLNNVAEEAKGNEPNSTSVKVVVFEPKQVSTESKESENESNIETAGQGEKQTEAEQESEANVEETGDIFDREIKVIEEVTDEVCNDNEYLENREKPKESDKPVVENVKPKCQYPRNCEKCDKYLRNNLDFRKHIVACMMARR